MSSAFYPTILHHLPHSTTAMAPHTHTRLATITHSACRHLLATTMATPFTTTTHPTSFYCQTPPPASGAFVDQVVLHYVDHELQQLRRFSVPSYIYRELLRHGILRNFSTSHEHFQATVPPLLRTRYKWGFRKTFTIPYGIVHLKEKKQWRKGRTIISYYRSLTGNLFRVTSRALDTILRTPLPSKPRPTSPNSGSTSSNTWPQPSTIQSHSTV